MGPVTAPEVAPDRQEQDRLWLRGGFPDSLLAASDADSFVFRQDLVRTYLERDVPQLGPRVPAETLRRLWTMLAHNQGQLLNASRLAASFGASSTTVARYIDLLVDLLLLRRLEPLHANVGKRLVRSPKIYVRDSGIVHALLRLETLDDLLGHPVVGSSWEGYAIEALLAAAPGAGVSFYRTAAGAEVDLVLELGGSRGSWAVEIKRGLDPGVSQRTQECVRRPAADAHVRGVLGHRGVSVDPRRRGNWPSRAGGAAADVGIGSHEHHPKRTQLLVRSVVRGGKRADPCELLPAGTTRARVGA